MSFRSPLASVAFVAFCSIALSGCYDRGPKLPPTVPVSGNVTLNGQPLTRGIITFSPVEPGPASSGQVIDGQIVELRSNGIKSGVVVGEHRVTIYDEDVESGSVDIVPNRYGSLDTALQASVTETGPNAFTFELKQN
ncbi:hypothetical protein [Blastopirellula marina]|uniref:Lipoprotein n=1 Tax=Blastopirellula marina DSM 3645 TaxID=314230 RepID=A3ZWL7_9BACT|nr:hypothetical protein [Blastopirellula marina]EAQ78991.1 hypothetical protein DSM3645_13545 [Blastopirellula marina DSM 3645]